MNIKLTMALCLLSNILTGCASNNYTDAPPAMGGMYSKYAVIGYSGDLRSVEEVGVVAADGLIKIKSVDNHPVSRYRAFTSTGFYSGGRYQLHLLPGAHTVVLGFSDNRGGDSISWSTSDVTKPFSISKGQVVHFSLLRDGGTWTAKESDGGSALETIASDFSELTSKR